jgi:glycosyltransferase involved in cell wall biosynthesis
MKRPKKLLIPFQSVARGGAEEYALDVARFALAHGWDVTALCLPRRDDEGLADELRRMGAAVRSLNLSFSHDDFGKLSLLDLAKLGAKAALAVRAASSERAVAMHVPLPTPSLGFLALTAAAAASVPAVCVFQLAAQDASLPGWLRYYYARLRGRKQTYVAVSRQNRAVISRMFGVAEGEIALVPNACPLIERDPETREKVRHLLAEQHGVPEGSTVLLTVARLSGQKGHRHLVRVLPDLLAAHPECHLLWVGEGESREELEASLRSHGAGRHVTLLGQRPRSEVAGYLAAADLFVFPTEYEGQPFSLMEAMATGLPVVSSDASGIAEILEHRREGLLHRAGDADDLLAQLLVALGNMNGMGRMAAEARARMARYTREDMLADTLRLIETRAGGRERGRVR